MVSRAATGMVALAALDADGTRKKILEKYGVWAPYQAKLLK